METPSTADRGIRSMTACRAYAFPACVSRSPRERRVASMRNGPPLREEGRPASGGCALLRGGRRRDEGLARGGDLGQARRDARADARLDRRPVLDDALTQL